MALKKKENDRFSFQTACARAATTFWRASKHLLHGSLVRQESRVTRNWFHLPWKHPAPTFGWGTSKIALKQWQLLFRAKWASLHTAFTNTSIVLMLDLSNVCSHCRSWSLFPGFELFTTKCWVQCLVFVQTSASIMPKIIYSFWQIAA